MSAAGPEPSTRAAIALGLLPSLRLALLTWVLKANGLLTMDGHMLVVRDYLWLWSAGQLLAAGQVATIFDPTGFPDFSRRLFGPQLDDVPFYYPPSMLFLAWPTRYAPLLAGFAIFAAAQIALLWAVGRAAGLSRRVLLAVSLSPALLESVLAGQNGGMTSALLVGGLLLAGRRSILAGILLGLLTIKPQLGLVVPVALVAARDWKAIAAAVGTALALVLASGLAFGFDAWTMFWTNTLPAVTQNMRMDWQGLYFQELMVSPFMALRSYGASLAVSDATQLIVSLSSMVMVWKLWRPVATSPAIRMAATTCFGILATPYGYTYDTVSIAVAIAVFVASRPAVGLAERVVLILAWLWPGLAVTLSPAGLQPLGCLLIAAVAWLNVRWLEHFPRQLARE